MNVVFAVVAQQEFDEALAHYGAISELQAERFRQDILATIRRAMDPGVDYRRIAPGVHLLHCDTFPYYVAYSKKPNEVLVLVVAHDKRNPISWRKRLLKEH